MSWATFFRGEAAARHAPVLLRYLVARRWFRGKARSVAGATIVDVVTVPCGAADPELAHIALLRVGYHAGEAETYLLPLAFRGGSAGERLAREIPGAVVMEAVVAGEAGVVHDALAAGPLADALLEAIASGRSFSGKHGELRTHRLDGFDEVARGDLKARLSRTEQTNSAVFYGDRVMMKVYRRLDHGINPELEISEFLGRCRGLLTPRTVASIDYRSAGGVRAAVAMVQEVMINRGDAWSTTLEDLKRVFDSALASGHQPPPMWNLFGAWPDRVRRPAEVYRAFALVTPTIETLARRTGELHLALGSPADDPAFAPEALTLQRQRSMRDAARELFAATLSLLVARVELLPPDTRALGRQLVARSGEVERRLDDVAAREIDAALTRIHGDLHLGQVLTVRRGGSDDFVIIDFEGEPGRTLAERRAKSSPLRDVAGMLRSFHYAAASALRAHEQRDRLQGWAAAWTTWVSRVFLGAYFETAKAAAFVPQDQASTRSLLEFYLLEKCIYEVGYELNNRPDWVDIPLQGMHDLLLQP